MSSRKTKYISPSGITEQAIALDEIPDGTYTFKDRKKEDRFLAIDFYEQSITLTPKTWSTSPATMIRDISQVDGSSQSAYENQALGKTVASTVKKVAKFKQSMNQSGTSGTFSTASLLYYHFSCYFDTVTKVPTAIYREMDRKIHCKRVTEFGRKRTSRGMIAKGWEHLYRAEKTPNSYQPMNELFTPERDKIYGVLLNGKGTRYGAEINGARKRGWGSPQNEEFQETAPYFALRSDKPLLEAINEGKRRMDRTVRIASGDPSPFQMIYWMRELTEIVLLDYIFSQQDRVGNIDYRWAWYWIEAGMVKKQWYESKQSRKRMRSQSPPATIRQFSPVLIQRTCLNDNDAGGRVPYANFAKKTGMLQKLRHISAKTYTKLIQLDQDLQSQGAIYRYIEENFILDAGQRRQIVKNTHLAADILKDTHEIGKLRFDLDNPKKFLLTEKVKETFIDFNSL